MKILLHQLDPEMGEAAKLLIWLIIGIPGGALFSVFMHQFNPSCNQIIVGIFYILGLCLFCGFLSWGVKHFLVCKPENDIPNKHTDQTPKEN